MGDTTVETIDEPVSATLFRDLKAIIVKLSHVILPRGDLWGPLLLCLLLAMCRLLSSLVNPRRILSIAAPSEQGPLMFAAVFVIVWVGGVVVTVNALLLGGKLSFFQSICVLGYCLFPLNLAAVLGIFVSNIIARSVFVCVGFIWATLGFMAELVPAGRKGVAVYPIFLFYLCIAWMVLINGGR